MSLVRRISLNKFIHILVVDDSSTVRNHLVRLLSAHEFIVHEAGDGDTALDVLERHPEIKAVITDYFMPGMDGVELTRRIRRLHHKDQLAVIGISAYGNSILSARFIKNGANDFLNKPFPARNLLSGDPESGDARIHPEAAGNLHSRPPDRTLQPTPFLRGLGPLPRRLAQGERNHDLAMIDIDHFKHVNDTYGHAVGDAVLKHVAHGLSNRFRGGDMVARLGGEEFCVIARGLTGQQAMDVFNDLRNSIERSKAKTARASVGVTISIGICDRPLGSLDAMLAAADAALYKAKRAGRNRVMWAD